MEKGKKGFLERGANFFEKLHYGIGAIALAGSVLLESTTLAVVGAYEILHGVVWKFIKDGVRKKPQGGTVTNIASHPRFNRKPGQNAPVLKAA